MTYNHCDWFQIAYQYDEFNNSAGGCGMREEEVGDVEEVIGDV